MILEKYLTDSKSIVTTLTQFVVLLSLSIVAPLLHNQIITGSLVNAALFIGVATLGTFGAGLICLLPSIFALASGTLPTALALLIPFIMVSNIILVLLFNYFRKYNYWLGVFSASVVKFLFLYTISFFIANFFLTGFSSKLAITMFSWPQLLTALIGGAMAYFILKFSKTAYEK